MCSEGNPYTSPMAERLCIYREVYAKEILTRSRVYEYTVNPYRGCYHGCSYCYARFMKRFLGRKEEWGSFVDVKVNAAELLAKEMTRKRRGTVWISGVCDPYQPCERERRLTGRCIEVLIERGWPIVVQTKSPLVLVDRELLKSSESVDVFFSISTADERIRRMFEPFAPSAWERISALRVLASDGVRCHLMIAPLLPGAEGLVEQLKEYVSSVLIDRMNYHYADGVYRKHGLNWARTESFFRERASQIYGLFRDAGVACEILFS